MFQEVHDLDKAFSINLIANDETMPPQVVQSLSMSQLS